MVCTYLKKVNVETRTKTINNYNFNLLDGNMLPLLYKPSAYYKPFQLIFNYRMRKVAESSHNQLIHFLKDCVFYLNVFMYTTCMPCAQGGQREHRVP